jgi:hypothetical protein
VRSRRPDFNQAVAMLIAHVTKTMPEFGHLDPARILVVAGEARRASRGTVKPLTFSGQRRRDSVGRTKPLVRVSGQHMLYSITLRPLFFRRSTPRQRVATVLHELFHIAHDFDGALDHRRRHAAAGGGFEQEFRPVERRAWKHLPDEVLRAFSHNGEVRVRQWLEKPQSWLAGERASQRSLYTEKHLFEGVVRMKTPPKKAPGSARPREEVGSPRPISDSPGEVEVKR